MITSMEFLLRVALFEFVAFLILGAVLLCRRFSDQPLERIRLTQIVFAAVFAALFLTATSVVPAWVFVSLSTPEISATATIEREPLKTGDEKLREIEELDAVAGKPFPVRIQQLPLRDVALAEPTEVEIPRQDISTGNIIPEARFAAKTQAVRRAETKISSWFSFEVAALILLCLPGVLLLLLNLAAKLKLRRILRRSKPAPDFVQKLFETIKKTSKRRVELRISGDVDAPQVFGLRRPVLLLPSILCEEPNGDDRALRACLAHEWSHLRRGDLPTWFIVRLFQYPLWMQPFYWMLCAKLLADQDFLADDEGARSVSDRTDYAEVLLELARKRFSSLHGNVLGMAGRKSQLMRRIEMIFDDERNLLQKTRKRKLLLPVVLVAVLTLLGGSIRFGSKTVAQESSPQPVAEKKSEPETPPETPPKEKVADTALQPLEITKTDGKFEVKGILYGTDGKPVEGASVLLYTEKNSGPSEIVDQAAPIRTAADGSFNVSGKKMFCILAVSKDKRDLFLHKIPQEPEKATSEQRSPIAQLKRGEKLSGKVVDKDGKPIEGATVGYYSLTRINAQTESGNDGNFELYYPQGSEIVAIFAMKSKAGFDYKIFRSEFDDKNLNEDAPPVDLTQSFTLTLTGAKTVRVKAQWEGGVPAAGITIAPWTLRNPNLRMIVPTDPSFNFAFMQYSSRNETDKDGVVEFDWMPVWADRIGFFYADFPWWSPNIPWKRFDIDCKKDGDEKILILRRPLKASGTVRYPDGKPAQGITVKCEGGTLNYDFKRYSAKTNADGRYEISLDPEAAYVFGIENGDWGAVPRNPLVVNAKTKPEELQNLDFSLRKTVRVHGNVVFGPKKEHLKGLKVSFSVSGKTDLDLPKEKQLTPVESRERRRGNEGGGGGSDLRYGLWYGETPIDDEGNFSKRLGPGEYKVGISEPFIGISGLVRALLPEDAKLIVPENAGEEIVLNLEAKESGNARLRGKVLSADGTPAVGAKLIGAFHKENFSDSITPDFSAETDAEGNFDARRTLEPVWLFAKSKDGTQQAVLSLDEKTETLGAPIRLQGLGTATGRVVDLQGRPIPNLEIRYGVPVFGIFDKENLYDKQRDFPQRIRSRLRFGGTVKSDADGKFRLDGVIADSDCYVVYPAAKKEQLGGNDGFQLAKVRLKKAGDTRDLGDCRVNPASMDGWKKPDSAELPKFTAKFVDDKSGKPITEQRVDIRWAKIPPKKEESEEKINGMTIRAYPARENPAFTGQELKTDAEGRVEFALPEQATVYDPKEVELQISCFRMLPAGSGPKEWNRIPYAMFFETFSGPFAGNRDFTFRLIPYPTVKGKILDPDGKPVAGASLQLTTSHHPKPKDADKPVFFHKEYDTETDADGVFRSMIAPDFDNGTMLCNAPGFVPSQIVLKGRNPDKPDDWIFTVQRGVDVSGRLVDPDGQGIAGLWVNFQRSSYGSVNDPLGRSVKSDAEGRFVAPALGTEEYKVSVTPIPCCPNAENAKQVPRYDIPPTNEKFVFCNKKFDPRTKEGEESKKPEPLNIVGYPTVPLNFTITDQTSNGGALQYSRFSFHGQLPDGKETWSVQKDPVRAPGDSKRASGVVQLPKGGTALLAGSLYGYVVKDGVGTILREKQNWTLEYRFSGDAEWKKCTESSAQGDPIIQQVAGPIGEIRDENLTLEIRIR